MINLVSPTNTNLKLKTGNEIMLMWVQNFQDFRRKTSNEENSHKHLSYGRAKRLSSTKASHLQSNFYVGLWYGSRGLYPFANPDIIKLKKGL